MKILIQRHISDLQVFRALAIAQAAAAAEPGAEIFLECFDKHRPILDLVAGVKWKNPHHPLEVSERKGGTDGTGKTQPGRPGGPIYDRVVNIDADSILEFELMKSGLPWWQFITGKLKAEGGFGATLKPAAFPELIDPPAPGPKFSRPVDFIVLAPLSDHAHAGHMNANRLEEYARKQFPAANIYWISPGNVFLGVGRPLIRIESPIELAWILKNSIAVFSVNGLVSAMAQSTITGHGRLVTNYYHVRGKIEKGFEKDLFAKLANALEVETDRGPDEQRCTVTTTAPDLSIIPAAAPAPAAN